MVSQNHRINEVGRDFWGSSCQRALLKVGPATAACPEPHPVEFWILPVSLGDLLWCLITKQGVCAGYLVFWWNFLYFIMCLLPHVLSLCTKGKTVSIFFTPSYQVHIDKIPPESMPSKGSRWGWLVCCSLDPPFFHHEYRSDVCFLLVLRNLLQLSWPLILPLIQLLMSFGFPDPSLHAQTVSLYAFRVTWPWFYLLCASFLCLRFVRSSLFIHTSFLCLISCIHRDETFLSLEEVLFEIQSALLCPSSLQDHLNEILSSRLLKRLLLKFRIVIL